MNCKNCKYGKYDKRTDTVMCRVLNKTLLFNRADDCYRYEDNAKVRRAKERGSNGNDAS